MEDRPKSERALMFLRSDSRNPYSRKLDPTVKGNEITFVGRWPARRIGK